MFKSIDHLGSGTSGFCYCVLLAEESNFKNSKKPNILKKLFKFCKNVFYHFLIREFKKNL